MNRLRLFVEKTKVQNKSTIASRSTFKYAGLANSCLRHQYPSRHQLTNFLPNSSGHKATIRQHHGYGIRNRIHISCDLWSSPNSLAILRIVAHFITGDGELRHVVLALREIDGAHTGENLSPVILDVIVDYGFESNLGFFMMDNASNNDTMMNHLSTRTCITII